MVLTPTTPTKPGYTTTEFGAGVVFPVIFLLLSQFNILHVDTNNPHVEAIVKLGSYVFAAVGAGFYAYSRGHMKAGAAISDGLKVLAGELPGMGSAVQQLAPAQAAAVAHIVAPYVAELKAFDPKFSEGQLEDLSNIIGGLLKRHSSQELEPLIRDAVKQIIHNVQNPVSPADEPPVAFAASEDTKIVADVIHAAEAPTPTGDGAAFIAPTFLG